MNQSSLFSDAKILENRIQDVLHVDPPEQSTQRLSRRPQFLRGEFLALSDDLHAALQQTCRIPQQFALPLPTDQPSLAGTEIILRKRNQRRAQFRDAIAPPRGNFELRSTPLATARSTQTDLVAARPNWRSSLMRQSFGLRTHHPQH